MARSALLNVMVQAARKATRNIRRDFGEVENLQVSMKGPADFVSAADRRVEQALHQELERVRPGYGFLMEESGAIKGADQSHRWIVDPIDGTTNFIHGIPHFAVSIALERHGELVAGVIYNPIMDELFVAERGGGAFLNDRRLRVTQRRELSDAVVCCGIPHRGRGDHALFRHELARVQAKATGIRRSGSAALDLAYVAAGRYDAYWERGLKPWDIAAGIVLVREAGGTVSDIDSGRDMLQTGNIMATNDALHGELGRELKAAQTASSARQAAG
ncbi:inositol monophosphatase [Kaustia mangrovi]|uniref:Inositol-1-monophosphatase n=1 Tax=Kaustia mangrovi TaxID=2593653 RepID=A0A7S8C5Y5_9HYPH|nr:inositol monophosphatase family protein [Kaustia mangrovi]QPC43926.1 inositol monophosphatase [Kaustia mangrovi]